MNNSALCFWLVLALPALASDSPDLEMVHRIKNEAFSHSQVMDHLFYLTDVNGPRLTGSPGYERAADWAVARIKGFGVENARLEPWGAFGKGWAFTGFSLRMNKPVYAQLHGVPLAWCEGTRGAVKGTTLSAPLLDPDEQRGDLDIAGLEEKIENYRKEWKGKVKGKIVLVDSLRELTQPLKPMAERLDDKALASLMENPELLPSAEPNWIPDRLPKDKKKRHALFQNAPLEILADHWRRLTRTANKLNLFLKEEGALALLATDRRGAGGILFAEAASLQDSENFSLPAFKLAPEDYNRILRLTEKGVPLELELSLDAKFIDSPRNVNVIAEIPGGKRKEEVVMLGGHLDSWHAGTGASDNGAGSAVVLEAFRVLKALNVAPDRTIRLALWGGEEQGMYGSRGYVREHFADPFSMALKPEHARFAGYFNVDNGSGKIRGIHLQGNDMARPIFEAWLAPFKDLGAATVTIRDTSGTDHMTFDEVGLPGFQFIQDPLDYSSRTHHSELDVYDHAEPGDLMQASAVLASFVYNAAVREMMLPRKPLPKPLPARN